MQAAGKTFVVLVVSALATWCLIGPLREPGGEARFSVPDPPRWAELVVGLVAVASTGVAAWALARTNPPAIVAAVLAVAGGLVAGGSLRLMTATSVGANIGGGIALLIGLPTALVLASVAVVVATRSPGPAPAPSPAS